MAAPQPVVGEEIPTFTRETGFASWNRFAAVNHEFVPIHMDDEAGRNAGYPGALGMGNLQWAYLTALLRDWVAEEGRIVSMSCQFRAPNLKGQVVAAHGKITGVREEGGETLVDLAIWTSAGEAELAKGTATVALLATPAR